MSIEKINLRKLLQLLYADNRLQRSLLLADIRSDRSKKDGEDSAGGDFYGPFWADVKDHAAGRSDISRQTELRIASNKARARLYPILRDSFLEMWTEKMRWRNEPFEFVPTSVKAQLPINELGTIIKIENMAAIRTWDGSHRVLYPYFSEAPALPDEGARLGFQILKEALPNFNLEDFRIIDMQRRVYYRSTDILMRGNERELLLMKYDALLRLWRSLGGGR
jgi:hypothetical protein